MSHYRSNLRDIEFDLLEVMGRGDVLGTGPQADGSWFRQATNRRKGGWATVPVSEVGAGPMSSR